MLATAPGITDYTAKSRKTKNALLGVALAFGLATATLNMAAPANAWCVGISGIDIQLGGGGHCASSLGSFAIGLGDGAVAEAHGFLTGAIAVGAANATTTGVLTAAWAGGTGSQALTNGVLTWAMAQGTNVLAEAGFNSSDWGDFAFNFGRADDAPGSGGPATSTVSSGWGAFNVAANLFGNANTGKPLRVTAGGLDTKPGATFNAAINMIGSNRNILEVFGGALNLGINVGNIFAFPNGSDTTITIGDIANQIPANLSLAFNVQPPFITPSCDANCGNVLSIGNGFLSVVGAVGLVGANFGLNGPGIKIKTPLNPTAAINPVSATATTSSALAARAPASVTATTNVTGSQAASTPNQTLANAGQKVGRSPGTGTGVGGASGVNGAKSRPSVSLGSGGRSTGTKSVGAGTNK